MEQKGVLIIFSGAPGAPSYDLLLEKITSDLGVGLGEPFNLYLDFLDQSRFPDEQSIQLHFEFMRRKYSAAKIDLIIAIGPRISPLISRYAPPRFDEIPTLYVDLESGTYDTTSFVRKPNTTAVIGKFDLKKTIETALSLHPTSASIYVISGVAPMDRFYETVARRVLTEYENRIRVTYLSGLTMKELLEKVSSLPRNGIMIYLSFYEDTAGKKYYPRASLEVISKRSKVPAYGFVDSYIGYGIIGGYVLSVERIGDKAGELALRILRGEHPDALPVIREGLNLHMFDWQQLKRWGVNENLLPEGSVLVNHPPTLWKQYKRLVVGAIAVFIAQTLLVIGLLIQRTLKKKAESSLQRKTEELDQFFNISLDLLCIANSEGYFLRLNPSWEKALGYTRDELMARPFIDFIHADDLLKTQEAASVQASQQRVIHFENRYRCKDGTYRWLEWSSVPAGNLIYAAARDVTDRKRSEEALRESEARFRATFEQTTVGIAHVSPEGRFLRINPKFCGIVGYSSAELLERTFRDITLPDDLDADVKQRDRLLCGEIGTYTLEKRYVRKDGGLVWCSVTFSLVRREFGEPQWLIAVVEDITARKEAARERAQLRNELAHVQRVSTMGQLSSALAHELNQPLGAILNNASTAQILSAKLKGGDPEFGEILADIIADAVRAGEVIRKIRGIVKKEETKFELLNLNVLIEEVVELYRNVLNMEEVLILLDLQPDLATVRADRVHLQQVLINLINNAAEAMVKSSSRTLKIRSTLQSPGMIIVSVSDSGTGIDEAKKDKLFEPFFTTKKDGLGMGLRICRSIIEEHEGRIWVENNSGVGATFSFSLKAYGGSSG